MGCAAYEIESDDHVTFLALARWYCCRRRRLCVAFDVVGAFARRARNRRARGLRIARANESIQPRSRRVACTYEPSPLGM